MGAVEKSVAEEHDVVVSDLKGLMRSLPEGLLIWKASDMDSIVSLSHPVRPWIEVSSAVL